MDADVEKVGMKKSGYAPVNGLKLYYEIREELDQDHPWQRMVPLFRFYVPTETYFDKPWQLNDIEQVK